MFGPGMCLDRLVLAQGGLKTISPLVTKEGQRSANYGIQIASVLRARITTEQTRGGLSILKLTSLVLAIIGSVAGLIAAHYWYRASKVAISPAWELVPSRELETKNIMGWVTGNMIAFTSSGKLNKYAARWSAVAVMASGFSALFGSLWEK